MMPSLFCPTAPLPSKNMKRRKSRGARREPVAFPQSPVNFAVSPLLLLSPSLKAPVTSLPSPLTACPLHRALTGRQRTGTEHCRPTLAEVWMAVTNYGYSTLQVAFAKPVGCFLEEDGPCSESVARELSRTTPQCPSTACPGAFSLYEKG